MQAIANNTGEIFSIATQMRFKDIPEEVFVGIPISLGTTLGKTLYSRLSKNEQDALGEAAKAIYETYISAIEGIEQKNLHNL